MTTAKLLEDYFDTDHLICCIPPTQLDAPQRLSPKRVAELGWTRTADGLCGANFSHPTGWHVQHCGHPTALWPWALYNPEGRMVRAYNGRAWRRASEALLFVALVLAAA